MPDSTQLVINTGPTLALIAAVGDLTLLKRLYAKVYMPFEVVRELSSGTSSFGADVVLKADCVNKGLQRI